VNKEQRAVSSEKDPQLPIPYSLLPTPHSPFTYADYLEWDDDVRAEIIQGVAYMMAPPLTVHQRIAGRLFTKLAAFLEGKTCEVFIAPFGVRLFPQKDKSDDTVVEPDIVVICDPSKIDERGCNGAPDLIIEILSPSNSRKDRFLKYDLYLKAMVKEYWVVSPEKNEIEVHILDQGHYATQIYGLNEPDTMEEMKVQEFIPVAVLPGLEISVKDIFFMRAATKRFGKKH
jgi:Uma2 family endonuclease